MEDVINSPFKELEYKVAKLEGMKLELGHEHQKQFELIQMVHN